MRNFQKYSLAAYILLLMVVVFILFSPARKLKKRVKPVRVFKGKIAIVLDDWGYNLKNLPAVEEIRLPLTLAVLPNLALTKEVSRRLHQRGFEIILHLPMEPKEKFSLEKETIRVSMGEAQIKNIISADLGSILYAQGVSNHMGSRATSDPLTMSIVFGELKKRNLYFLDSFVTGDSACAKSALQAGLRFAKRDIFLDNSNDPRYIRQQIYRLKSRARLRGYAIGIGHDRKNTLRVLKTIMPELEKEGYKFVFVSELAS